jgi:sulfur-carrier protein
VPMVTMRYWAAAKQAAGVAEETLPAATLAEALTEARSRHTPGGGAAGGTAAGAGSFEAVLARSSLLVDGEQVGRRGMEQVTLRDGAVIEVLPPFAGG